MSRTIILPLKILKGLTKFTEFREESNGVLLYSQQGEECFVEAVYVTGIGSEGKVQSEEMKSKAVFGFLKENPEYNFIKFHTHTVGTVEQFGDKYAREFSQGDISGIKERLKDDPHYMAMLVTPETYLLTGKDSPILRIVKQSELYEQNHEKILSSLKHIEESLGVEKEGPKEKMKIR